MSPIDKTLARVQEEARRRRHRLVSDSYCDGHFMALFDMIDVLAAELRVINAQLDARKGLERSNETN